MKVTRVLIIDSDPATRDTLATAFSTDGFDPIIALDAQGAIYQLLVGRPHIMVLDLMLDSPHDTPTVGELRKFSSAPLICLVDSDDLDTIVHSLDRGADDVMVKPIDFGELRARVRALLRRSIHPRREPHV